MGLDIYFEKRAKNADYSEYEKTYERRKELDNQLEEFFSNVGGEKGELVYDAYRKHKKGEDISEYSTDVLDLMYEIKPTQDEYLMLGDKLEELNPRKEIAYFRKVNLLMVFFDYMENCEYKEVTKGEVEELVDRCRKVLKKHSLAKELLPTTGGFFFGSTEYDEYYFDELKNIRDTFKKILKGTDWENETVEMFCWW